MVVSILGMHSSLHSDASTNVLSRARASAGRKARSTAIKLTVLRSTARTLFAAAQINRYRADNHHMRAYVPDFSKATTLRLRRSASTTSRYRR